MYSLNHFHKFLNYSFSCINARWHSMFQTSSTCERSNDVTPCIYMYYVILPRRKHISLVSHLFSLVSGLSCVHSWNLKYVGQVFVLVMLSTPMQRNFYCYDRTINQTCRPRSSYLTYIYEPFHLYRPVWYVPDQGSDHTILDI